MIWYKLCIDTEDEMIEMSTFCSDLPIGNHRISKEIHDQFIKHKVFGISVDKVKEIILVSVDDSGRFECHPVEPEDVWPLEFNISNKTSKHYKGGDKD